MCGSRKYPYQPQGWSLEIPRGRGGLKSQNFLRGSMKQNLTFQGVGVVVGTVQTQKPSLGEVWIFSGTTHKLTGF